MNQKTDRALLHFLVRWLNLLAVRVDTSENKRLCWDNIMYDGCAVQLLLNFVIYQNEKVPFRHFIVIWKWGFFFQWLVMHSVKNMHFISAYIYFPLLAFLGHDAFVLPNTSFYSSCLLIMSFLVSGLAFFWSCFYLSYFLSFSTLLTLN